ncbi:MAG: haloacid dehalogenase type II [Deltaproteobacteria bacterium]|nr:haloacid dehalogenase type II [Deltaproteobacteria bacterium]
MLDFDAFEVMTFDCYGTLIDWETGILSSLRRIMGNSISRIGDEEILELYGRLEAEAESGDFINYKSVLRRVLQEMGRHLGFAPTEEALDRFMYSLKDWPPFRDTPAALRALKRRYRLAVISNVDDDLFEFSQKLMDIKFDWIITAEQVRSYKPSLRNFQYAIERIGIAPGRILHVAQSHYHDIVPAGTMGLATVWINRRAGRNGPGATRAAQGTPDLEVPDLESLVSIINGNTARYGGKS